MQKHQKPGPQLMMDTKNKYSVNPYQLYHHKTKYYIRYSSINNNYSIIEPSLRNKIQNQMDAYKDDGNTNNERDCYSYSDVCQECFLYVGVGVAGGECLSDRYRVLCGEEGKGKGQGGEVTGLFLEYFKSVIQTYYSVIYENDQQRILKQLFGQQHQLSSQIQKALFNSLPYTEISKQQQQKIKQNNKALYKKYNESRFSSSLKLNTNTNINMNSHSNSNLKSKSKSKSKSQSQSKQKNNIKKQSNCVQRDQNQLAESKFMETMTDVLRCLPIQMYRDRMQGLLWLGRRFKGGMFDIQVGKLSSAYCTDKSQIYIKCNNPQISPKFNHPTLQNIPQSPLQPQSSPLPLPLPLLINSLQKQYTQSESSSMEDIRKQHYRLLYKMCQQIISQLLEYQLISGKQYPMLHPCNIVYYGKKDCFQLLVGPVLVQAYGVKDFYRGGGKVRQWQWEDGCYFQRDFNRDIGFVISNTYKMLILIAMLQTLTPHIPQYLNPTHFNNPSNLSKQLYTKKTTPPNQNFPSLQDLLQKWHFLPKTLLHLQKLLKIRTHTSIISLSRYQNLLSLRYKISKQCYKLFSQFLTFISNRVEFQNIRKDVIGMKEIWRSICCGFGLEVKSFLRKEDKEIYEQISIQLNQLINVEESNNVDRNFFKNNYIPDPLLHFASYKHHYNNPQTTHQYVCHIHQLLIAVQINDPLSKLAQKQKKLRSYKHTEEDKKKYNYYRLFGYLREMDKILGVLLLKIDQNTLFWAQYIIFKKVVSIVKGQVSVDELDGISKIVDAKENAGEECGLWWGF